MNKKDCDIVKDLAVGYAENLLSSNSKNFVEKHLQNCDECQKYYKAINSNIFNDSTIEKNKDKIEIDYLKKVKNHINVLKSILILVLIFSIVIISLLTIKYCTISNVINKAYSKIEYMRNLDNYKLTKRTINKSFSDSNNSFDVTFTYYYKDGKYKIEYGDNSTTYLEDDGYNKICVYDDLTQIEYYTQNFVEIKKGAPINIFYDILNYKKLYPRLYILGLSMRNDSFEGKDCYVIRNGNEDSYKDIWIDKATLTTVRTVSEEKSKYYTEEIYTFEESATTDEDVDNSILNTEKYQDYTKLEINNNATEEIELYYELLDKNGRY